MLYRILKYLFLPTYSVYFRSLTINNKKGLPLDGPLVLAVNHTSAFMDPILVAVKFDRVFNFLARGEAFNSKFAKSMYANLNMLPIYRPETMPDDVHKNKFIFEKCYEHLNNGKAIMMFPEGFSKTERRLRPIKTGLARMALGAESENNWELGTKVLAVGLNYSNPHIFRSDVFINVGNAIDVREFRDIYEEDPKKGVDALTERVKVEMEATTVVIGDERTDVFIANLEKLLQLDLDKGKLGLKSFETTKELVQNIEDLAEKEPEQFKSIELRLANYVQRLNRLGLKRNRIFEGRIKSSLILNVLLLILGFPLFAIGAVLNAVPYWLTVFVSRKVQVRDDFVGSLKTAAGMFLFLIFYILTALIIGSYSTWYIGLISFFLLHPLMIFVLHYINRFLDLIQDYKHTRLFRRKSTFMDNMRKERSDILRDLNISH